MKRFLYFILFMLILASCATTRQAEVTEQPRHQTAQVKRAMVTLKTNAGQQVTVGCMMQTVFDSLCVVSVQPLAGMEVMALYATPQQILLIDRMNRRYAETNYMVINSVLQPHITYADLEQLTSGVTEEETPATGGWSQSRHYSAGKQEADLTIVYPSVQYDEPIMVRPQRIENYQKTDIRTLLSAAKR